MQQSVAVPAFVYWPALRAFYLWVMAPANGPDYDEFRHMCKNDYAAAVIIHKVKTEWIFSGVRQDEKGFFSDIGIERSPKRFNRAQALRYYHRQYPKAVIKHIDDANKIITYAITG